MKEPDKPDIPQKVEKIDILSLIFDIMDRFDDYIFEVNDITTFTEIEYGVLVTHRDYIRLIKQKKINEDIIRSKLHHKPQNYTKFIYSILNPKAWIG